MDTIPALAVALATGLLIGLERGWHTRKDDGIVTGLRSFALLGLLGGVGGLLTAAGGGAPALAAILLGAAAVLVAGYWARAARAERAPGMTTLIAAVLTVVLGAAATSGYPLEAAMAGVATVVLLGYKRMLHGWMRALSREEIHAALKLLAISVLVLPLLPNEGYGPWDALNPFKIWWMVVLIAGISFCGYFAMRIAGEERGALLTGLVAGLASSTALTLQFSRLAARRPEAADSLGAGILVACGTMFPRMAVVATVVHPPLLGALIPAAAGMTLAVYAAAGLLWWRIGRSGAPAEAPRLSNPLELTQALLFAALLTAILLAAKAVGLWFGEAGTLAVAALSGTNDVDAITLSLASMSGTEIALGLAVQGIVLAGAVNSLVKAAMAGLIGGRGLALRVVPPLALAAGIGLALAWSGVAVPDLGLVGA